MKKLSLFALSLICALSSSAQTLTDQQLREYAASMLMVGFKGSTADSKSDAARYLRDLKVGGIILFDVDLTGDATIGSRNFVSREQVRQLTDSLRSFSGGRPFFIAADQEGGRVARLKTQYGFHPTVSAQHLGKVNKEDTTRKYARIMAEDLADAGINMNLGPILDVNINPNCPVIGKLLRSFSSDPNQVAKHAQWFIEEHAKKGIVCAVKHFPGHGSSTEDSHYGLTDISSTWSPKELIPYQTLIKAGKLKAVMSAHIFNRQLDPYQPGTLSQKMLTDLLRNHLLFDGIILSDDMYMKGIIDNYQISDAIIMAINAGVDMMIMGNNISTGYEPERPFNVVDIIVKAVKKGLIPEERIIDAHARITRTLAEM